MNCDTWSLELISAAAYAKSLWEKPTIKEKIIEVCEQERYCASEREYRLIALTRELVTEVNEKNLPDAASDYIIHIVKSMGKKIINWTNFLQTRFRFILIKLINPIFWTYLGTIDQAKIFQELTSEKSEFPDPCYKYQLACCCAQVEFFKNRCLESEEYVKNNCYRLGTSNLINMLLACTFSYVNEDVAWFERDHDLISKNKSVEANIFCLAAEAGYAALAKYFWSKMSIIEQEDEDNILHVAHKCISLGKLNLRSAFIQDNYVEILIFLMNKMSDDKRKELLSSNGCKILCMLTPVWPEQIFFIPIWEKIRSSFSASECFKILINILLHWEKDDKIQLSTCNNFYFEIFKTIWDFLPQNFKIEIITENELHDQFHNNKIMFKLFSMFHIEGLKLVINDGDLSSQRDYLIGKGEWLFKKLILTGNFEKLDLFVREIFNSDEDKEQKFKLKMNFYEALIFWNDKLDTAKQLLNWQLGFKNDRKKLISSQIDCEKICRWLMGYDKYCTVDSFIEWIFESDEEKENFKNTLRNEDFIKKKIYTIWSNINNPSSQAQTDRFLKWIFQSEDQIHKFKTEKLMSSESIIMFCKEMNSSLVPKKTIVLNKFLAYCEVPSQEIPLIKVDLLGKLRSLVLSVNTEKVMFSVIDLLVDWSTKNKNHKKEFIKNLMRSVDIVLFWDNITTIDRYELSRVFNEWIRRSRNIARLKIKLKSRKEDWAVLCLEKLEKNQHVFYDNVYHKNNDDSSDDLYDYASDDTSDEDEYEDLSIDDIFVRG